MGYVSEIQQVLWSISNSFHIYYDIADSSGNQDLNYQKYLVQSKIFRGDSQNIMTLGLFSPLIVLKVFRRK